MSNPYAIYKANYINNLPSGVTYNSTIARFFYNGKSFFTPQAVESYRIYLSKFGSANPILDLSPSVWIEPNDLTSVFQDVAGTVESQVGDPVALIKDLSPNGNDFTRYLSDDRRPTLVAYNGGYALESDGVDDLIELDLSLTDTYTFWMAGDFTTITETFDRLGSFAGDRGLDYDTPGYSTIETSSSKIRSARRPPTGSRFLGVISDKTAPYILVEMSADGWQSFGPTGSNFTYVPSAPNNSERVHIFGTRYIGTDDSHSPMKLTSFGVIPRALSSEERATLSNYLDNLVA